MSVTEFIFDPGSLFPKIDNPDYRAWKRGRHVFLFNRNVEAGSEILIRVTPGWSNEEAVKLLIFSTVVQGERRETRVYSLVDPRGDCSLMDRLWVLWKLVYHAQPFELQYSLYELVQEWGPFYDLPPNCVGSIEMPARHDQWDEYRVPMGTTAGQGLQHLANMSGFSVEETELEMNMAEDIWEPDDYRTFPQHVVTNPVTGRSVTTLWGSDNPMSDHEFVGHTPDGSKTYITPECSRPILATIRSWLLGC